MYRWSDSPALVVVTISPSSALDLFALGAAAAEDAGDPSAVRLRRSGKFWCVPIIGTGTTACLFWAALTKSRQ